MNYVANGLLSFVSGWMQAFLFLVGLILFVGVTPDAPLFTVVQTNDRWAMLIATMILSLVSGLMVAGAMGRRLDVYGSSWVYLNQIIISCLDKHTTRMGMWRLAIVLLDIGLELCGVMAGAGMFVQFYGMTAISHFLQPVYENTIVVAGTLSVGWSILSSCTLYLFLFHAAAFSLTYNPEPVSGVIPYAAAYWATGFVYFYTVRLLPNFSLNIAYGFAAGMHWETLWIDVIGGVVALIITTVLWYVLWEPFFGSDELSQVHASDRDARASYTLESKNKRGKGSRRQDIDPETVGNPMNQFLEKDRQ